MKVSLQWLKRYIDLGRPASEIGEALTLIGFEVESAETFGLPPLEKVVVGEVIESLPHPDADRLTVCQVKVSPEREPQTIVCGARNYKEGDRVPVALPGAGLPGGFKIKKAKIRGVTSKGMMCSPKELGLSEDHSGILVLEDRPDVGAPINNVLPPGDTVFDIEVTPNRPDCLSHLGIARELAAFFHQSFRYPEVYASPGGPFSESGRRILKAVRTDSPDCPHYRGYPIAGVKVGPSPPWMRQLLAAVGLRPINNVVDATNFVLCELGQPLHAFDAAKLRGGQIIVRQARPGEKMTTLDGKEHELDTSMMVIADAGQAIALAGIMGGLDSEVDENTADLVLESAYFNPGSIRATARKLGFSTDSSYRFERGVDPGGVEYAALRAIGLIAETAGGRPAGPPLTEGEPDLTRREITIAPGFVRQTLGFDVEDDEIMEVFDSLQLYNEACYDEAKGGDVWRVEIPSFRQDLDRPIDLVEEFLRIHGTDKIPGAPVAVSGLLDEDDPVAQYVRRAGQYLTSQHFNECVHYTLRDRGELMQWFTHAAAESLGLANPLAGDQSHLRTALLPGLLDAVQLNHYRGNHPSRLFETGRVFREKDAVIWEMVSAGFILAPACGEPSWLERSAPDFYTAARLVRRLLALGGAEEKAVQFHPIVNEDPWQEGHAAHAGGLDAGYEAKFGLFSFPVLRSWDLTGPVIGGAVFFLPDFLRKEKPRPRFKPFSQYPPAVRDLALVADAQTSAGQVWEDLRRAAKKAAGDKFGVEKISIFDVYKGKGLPEGKKSLAFSLAFRSSERTLTDEEVSCVFAEIQKQVTASGQYAIRS